MIEPDIGQECRPCNSFEGNVRIIFCRLSRVLRRRGSCIDAFGNVPTPVLAYIFERQGDIVLAEVLRISGRARLGAAAFVAEMEAFAGQSIKLRGRWKHLARFCSVDRNRRGKLVREDILAALEKICPSALASMAEEVFDDALELLDPNADGCIELEEWLAVFCGGIGSKADCVSSNAVLQLLAGKVPHPFPVRTAAELQSHLELMMRFFEADLDDDGRLSTRELSALLHAVPEVQPIVGPKVKQCWTTADVEHLHQKFDRDGHGKLYFSDFMSLHDSGALTPFLTPPGRLFLLTSWNKDAKAFLARQQPELISSDLFERVMEHLLRGGQARLLRGDRGLWAKLEQASGGLDSEQEQSPQSSRSLPVPSTSRSLMRPGPLEEPASARSEPRRKLDTSKFSSEPAKVHANSSSLEERGMPTVPEVARPKPSLRMLVASHFITHPAQPSANASLPMEHSAPVSPVGARPAARFRMPAYKSSPEPAEDAQSSSSSDEGDSSFGQVAQEQPSTPDCRSSLDPIRSESMPKDSPRNAKRRSSWSSGSSVPASVSSNRLHGAAQRRLSSLAGAPITANQGVTTSSSQAQDIKAAMLGTAKLPRPMGADQVHIDSRRSPWGNASSMPVEVRSSARAGPSFVDYSGLRAKPFQSSGPLSPRIKVPPI